MTLQWLLHLFISTFRYNLYQQANTYRVPYNLRSEFHGMGFSFLNPFKKKLKAISVDYSTLQTYAKVHDLLFFNDQNMFLREESVSIPALIFDPYRGFYLFEHKNWTYASLKNANVQPAQKNSNKPTAISVDAPYDFMRQKFNEILHYDGCEIAKFVYMDALTSSEFNQLDESFSKLIPAENIIFFDDDSESIQRKLHDALEKVDAPLPTQSLLSALFVHHHFLPDTLHSEQVALNPDQLDFVEREFTHNIMVKGATGSGKSSSFLLKSVYEKLVNHEMRITYISPTLLSAELLKLRLLDIIEYSIIDIDLSSINIITPQQLIQKHYLMQNKKSSPAQATITPKMLKKRFDFADLVFCDDVHLLDDAFVNYLEHLCEEIPLIVSCDYLDFKDYPCISFPTDYRSPHEVTVLAAALLEDRDESFENTHICTYFNNPFVDTLLLVKQILKEDTSEDILVIGTDDKLTAALEEELTLYIGRSNTRVNEFEGLLYQNINQLLITDIKNLSGLQRKHVIVAGINEETSPYSLAYAMGRTMDKLYLMFEGDSSLKTFFQEKEVVCKK